MDPEAAPSDDPIEQAVLAFQAGGDREASFRRIVDGYYRPIRGFFGKRIFSADDCLELTQETFLRIYKGLDGFRHQAQFRSWAFRIAHTTYLRWLERQRSAETAGAAAAAESDREHGSEDQEPVALDTETPLDGVLRKETRQRLAAAIEALPEQERRCVTLRVYQDLSHQEVADFLGLQVGTVKAHLHHARQKLKARLEPFFRPIDF